MDPVAGADRHATVMGRVTDYTLEAVLQAAAVIGTTFDVELLSAVVGMETLDCVDTLEAAERLGIVTADPGPDRQRFVDSTAHQAVLDRMPASRRVELHAEVATAMCTVYANQLDAHVFELAGHWSAAAVGERRPHAADWLARAANAALDQADYPEATRLAERALEIGHAILAPTEQCALLLVRARASYRCLELFGALDACEQAAAVAASAGLAELRSDIALVVEPGLAFDANLRLRQLCSDALAALDESEVDRRVWLLARLADTCHYLGDAEGATAACEELARLEPLCADDAAAAAALHAQQMAVSGPAGLGTREALASRLEEVARRSASRTEMAWVHLWRIDLALQRGDLSGAQQHLADLRRLGVDASDVVVQWQFWRAEATLAQAQARFEDATRSANTAMELLDAVGNPLGRVVWAGQLTNIRYHTGFDPEFASLIGLDDDAFRPVGAIPALSDALVLLGVGRVSEAAARYRSLGPLPTWHFLPHSELFTWAYGMLCAVGLGEREDIAASRDRLQAFRGHHVAAGAGCVGYFGPVELWLGVASASLGLLDEATPDLERALVLCGANGAAAFQAQAQLELAHAHLARAGPGDLSRARALADEALRRAELLGMAPVVARAKGLLADADPARASVLTAREQEVAQLVGAALTNRAIAQKLYLSERTVANHVQHIFDKLGLRNRSQLVAWLQEHRMSST